MTAIMDIITNTGLEYHEKRNQLAMAAENMLPYVNIGVAAKKFLQSGIICDIGEGHAPYRPRYILPDYERYMEQGSSYLNVAPPCDMYEAVNALLILYRYVPSITGYPVYLGQVDLLLEKYRTTVSGAEFEKLIKLLLIHIDRTLPDGFVHMNIGPEETEAGRVILKLEKELKKAVPNISFKYSTQTSPEFAKLAIETALTTGKPYFVNHTSIANLLGDDYGMASCYNSLRVGGGSHTLARLNLKRAAELAVDYDEFISRILPETTSALCEIINARARFLVEEAKYFEASFLAKEQLISIEKFTSMAGIFGLYECVELLSGGRMGKEESAEAMAQNIIARAHELIKAQPAAYCNGTNGKLGFHAQSGIDTDVDVSAGVRIKTGQEPDLIEQLNLAANLHGFFDTGVSEIVVFDQTAQNNINGLLTIINGALKQGIKTLAISSSDSGLVRITGYLVKKSDINKYVSGERQREDTVKLGADSIANCKVLERVVRSC